jgi:hypothetical protein
MMPPSHAATSSPPKPGHECRGEVARPVVGEDSGELVDAEQDRRDGERDPQQHERLRDGIAAAAPSRRRQERASYLCGTAPEMTVPVPACESIDR